MTPRARARMLSILVVVFGLGLAVAFMLYGLSGKITYFHTPTELSNGQITGKQLTRIIRIGGLVKTGSVQRTGETYAFTVTDHTSDLSVIYKGVVPDLFREGQSVIAYGKYDAGARLFTADQVLAKHDENYMPREVTKALEKQR